MAILQTTVVSGNLNVTGSITGSQISASNGFTGSISGTLGQFTNLTASNLNIQNSLSLDVSSSTTAVTITQRGTGAAFIVNDFASDTTPFIIDADGRVGVSTTSPSGIFDARGETYFGAGAGIGNGIMYLRSYNSGTTKIETTAGGGSYTGLRIDSNYDNSGTTNKFNWFVDLGGFDNINRPGTQDTFNLGRRTSGSTDQTFLLVNNGGNVGIGTTNPTTRLHVKGSTAEIAIFETTASVGNNYIRFRNSTASLGYYGYGGTAANDLNISNEVPNANIIFITSGSGPVGTEKVRITAEGNVGIGSNNPVTRLQVNSSASSNYPVAIVRGSNTNKQLILGYHNSSDYSAIQSLDQGTQYTPLILNPDGANVGIGTTQPLCIFSVRTGPGLSWQSGFITGSASPDAGGIFYQTDDTGWKFNIGKLSGSTYTKQITIQDNGNVGIGTSSPAARLDVNSVTNAWASWTADTGGASFMAFKRGGTSTNVGYIGTDGGGILGISTTPGGLNFGIRSENDLLLMAGATERARITSAGNVGIGISTPLAKLHVIGTIAIRGDETPDNPKLYFQASDNSNRFTVETDLDGVPNNDLLGFRSNNTDNILVLRGDGNVGIGATDPGYRLDINGITRFRNIVRFVNNLWNVSDDGVNRFYFASSSDTYFGTNAGWVFQNATTNVVIINNNGSITALGSLNIGGSSQFQVNSSGNVIKLNNITTSFPSSQGAAGTVLRNDGSGNLSWATAGNTTFNVTTMSTSQALVATTHDIVLVTAGVTITLPTAVGISGKVFNIKRTGASAVTVATTSSQTIDGSTTYVLNTANQNLTVVSNGANWFIL
jgi:hypothetical protein